ncbi:MAG: hypothetical protein HY985_00380 [Magnetospirillum sp.]|nr:hypothetical protein [Magnetospirillum sp.]
MAGNEPDYWIGDDEEGWFFEITKDGYATRPQRNRVDAISQKESADGCKTMGLSHEHIVLFRIPHEELRDDFPKDLHISMLGRQDEDGLIVHGPDGFLDDEIFYDREELQKVVIEAEAAKKASGPRLF